MSQPSGWYDDPNDPTMLRYFDGVIWTNHTAPKKSPGFDAPSPWQQPATQSPGGSAPGGPAAGGSAPSGSAPAGTQGYGATPPGAVQDAAAGSGGQGYSAPTYGAAPPYPGGSGAAHPPGYPSAPPWQQPMHLGGSALTTPDGVLLSGWWKRVFARVIDWFVVLLVSLPVTLSSWNEAADIMGAFISDAITAAESGATPPAFPEELNGPVLRATILTWLIYAVYEVGLVTWRGTTVGKRLVNISVRLRERPGPPPLSAAIRRWFVKDLGNIAQVVPVLDFLGSVFSLVNSLWPLWDKRKQALHDKAAGTNVVVGQQPRPGASTTPIGQDGSWSNS